MIVKNNKIKEEFSNELNSKQDDESLNEDEKKLV